VRFQIPPFVLFLFFFFSFLWLGALLISFFFSLFFFLSSFPFIATPIWRNPVTSASKTVSGIITAGQVRRSFSLFPLFPYLPTEGKKGLDHSARYPGVVDLGFFFFFFFSFPFSPFPSSLAFHSGIFWEKNIAKKWIRKKIKGRRWKVSLFFPSPPSFPPPSPGSSGNFFSFPPLLPLLPHTEGR